MDKIKLRQQIKERKNSFENQATPDSSWKVILKNEERIQRLEKKTDEIFRVLALKKATPKK